MSAKKRAAEARWDELRGRWQINVQKDGARKTFLSSVKGRRGKADAEAKADEWLEAHTASDVRFDQEWDHYLDVVRSTTGIANATKIESMGRLYLLPIIAHTKLSNITSAKWQSCIDSAFKAGLSKRSCENVRAIITSFYRHCKKARLPLEEPFSLTIPRGARRAVRKILQPNDLRLLFSEDSITHYNKPQECFYIYAFRLIVILGLRRGELCGLRSADLKKNILHIQRSINSINEITTGKNENANRYIALPQRAQRVLEDQKRMLKRYGIVSPWLFPSIEGEQTESNSLYKYWYTYRNQHGIRSSLHELRHTMVSVLKSDVPEALLKMMVGHSEAMDTHGVYGHVLNGDLERTARIVDDVYNRILG